MMPRLSILVVATLLSPAASPTLALDASGYVSPTYGTMKTFAPGVDEPTFLAEVLRDTVPARAYGAKCDGATDDSRAFAKAQAVAGGGTVMWPAGTCILDAVTLDSGASHTGASGSKTVWRRKANSAANFFVSSVSGAHHVTLRDLVIDGNRSAQMRGANNLQFIGGPFALTLERVTSLGAKAVNGYGSGYLVFDGADIARNTSTRILASQFVDNDGGGIEVQGGGNYQVDLTEASRNGKTGIKFDKAAPPPIVGNADNLQITNNRTFSNGVDGIMVAGYQEGGTGVRPIWGPKKPQSRKSTVLGNKAAFNGRYGIGVQGDGHAVTSNQAWRNGGQPPGSGGGFLLNVSNSTFSGNFADDNVHYGVDAGGCYTTSITGNAIMNTGLSDNAPGFGLNVGGGANCSAAGNVLANNKGVGIYAIGVEGAGSISLFEANSYGTKITGNSITLPDSTSSGVVVTEGADVATVTDNDVYGGGDGFAFIFQGGSGSSSMFSLRQRGNTDWSHGGTGKTLASAATLVIPDAGDAFYISGATPISIIRTASSNFFEGKVRWVVPTSYTPGQLNPDASPAVVFSGGSCMTAPSGTAMISNAGAFMGVRMVNYGAGCASAPAMTIGGVGGLGSPQIGLNNFQDREITLQFFSSAPVQTGGNIGLAGNVALATVPGCQLRLRGSFGAWREISRSC
ncbi:right-handed parallel beta-helix repeat-containing protein [Methylorubrum rhodesianum]|uniref:right-handed parallel beta-helix repeat-containing protein n=1 Tax=Methylorubrum rhodesianum TaxID=29427 RepID=UPI0037466B69